MRALRLLPLLALTGLVLLAAPASAAAQAPATAQDSGEAKMLRKFRDHTSSKKEVATPCMMRLKKSHNNTAPSSTGIKFGPALIEFRYFVIKPHSRMSMATQTKSGRIRAGLPFIR